MYNTMKCRLCLIECSAPNGTPLFNNDDESNLTKMIAKYLFIQVTQLDSFSTVICKDCLQHIDEFHKFFQHIEKQQQILQNEFLEIKCIASEELPNSITLEHNDESMLDIKDFINEDEICLDRLKSTDEFGYADNISESDTESEENVPLQVLLSKEKSKRQAKKGMNEAEVQNKRQYKSRKRKTAEKSLDNTACKQTTVSIKDEDKCERGKNYLTPEENKSRNDMIAKYVDIKCEICDVRPESYDGLKIHFRKEHKRKAYITCCNTRFLRRWLLLDHIQSHLNPDRFKCCLCDKVLKSKNCLNIHIRNKHDDRGQLKHACSVCGKRFQHASNLNQHMFTHKKELDHICEICEKGFKSSVLLKVHYERMHKERKTFVCEICGKEYRLKVSFDRHVAEHQGRILDKTDKCSICGKWFTLKNLKNHLKRHELEESNCEECGKTFKSKSALATHIGYAHRHKIYKCTFCDRNFKRQSALNEHIAIHTGRKDYNCPHCPREFRSKANMYSHVKKIHVEEWAMAQINRYQCPNSEIKAKKT